MADYESVRRLRSGGAFAVRVDGPEEYLVLSVPGGPYSHDVLITESKRVALERWRREIAASGASEARVWAVMRETERAIEAAPGGLKKFWPVKKNRLTPAR